MSVFPQAALFSLAFRQEWAFPLQVWFQILIIPLIQARSGLNVSLSTGSYSVTSAALFQAPYPFGTLLSLLSEKEMLSVLSGFLFRSSFGFRHKLTLSFLRGLLKHRHSRLMSISAQIALQSSFSHHFFDLLYGFII